VKICKNEKCQHVFVFKSKKKDSMQGCTTKTCPECGEHALSNRSGVCSDPSCDYKFPSGHKTKKKKNPKNGKRKRKNRSSEFASQKKKKTMLKVQTAANEPQVENTPNYGLLFQINSFLNVEQRGPTELTRSNSLIPIPALAAAHVDNSLIELSSGLFDAPAKLARGNSLSLFAKAMPKPFEPVAFDYSDQELPDATFSQNVYENEEQIFSDFSTFFESSNEITWNMTTPTKMQHLTSLGSNMCDSNSCSRTHDDTQEGNMHDDLRNML